MLSAESILLGVLILLAATLYSSVGHAGASGYLAAMALVGIAPESMRVTALMLNVLVAILGSIRYARAGHFDWPTFWPFAVLSIPAAFVGGIIHLPPGLYTPVIGVLLLIAAVQLIRSAQRVAKVETVPQTRAVPLATAIATGGVIGLISGLTGTGGGIFLSPILLFTGWARTRLTSGISATFILVNSLAGLAGASFSVNALPAGLPMWATAAVGGGVIGTQLGSRWLPVPVLRYLLAAVLVIAGLKLILT